MAFDFTLDDLDFLTSARGERLLNELANADLSESNVLPLITQLRKTYDARESAAALETVRLRVKAHERFPDMLTRFYREIGLFFTAEALEQVSCSTARWYRHRLPKQKAPQSICDMCCGIGADSFNFSYSAPTVGIDIDPVRVAMARLNATARNDMNLTFQVGDARDIIPEADLIFFDPARRVIGPNGDTRRAYHVEAYTPPLSIIKRWGEKPIWVKLSPGVKLDQLAEYAPFASLTFISEGGELKEAMLRLHDGGANLQRRAYIGTPKHTISIETDPAIEAPLTDIPRRWLIEPDPAIIRAGAVAQVAVQHHGALMDSQIAYFTTDDNPEQAHLRAWRIRGWMPFNVKKLREELRAMQIHSVTVKKRGVAITPEALIAQLKLKGGKWDPTHSATLVLTRLDDQPIVLICDDIAIEKAEQGQYEDPVDGEG